MPIPKPKKTENKNEFIDRCMSDNVMIEEYPENEQRIAICNAAWEKHAKDFEEEKTYNVSDVEIFSVGKWNGQEYTEKDIDDMVTAFERTKNVLKPFLKLGHNEKQKMLSQDGLPSAGWITGLKRIGDKLLADFKNIPKKIKELIDLKAYGRFSSEVYHNVTIDGKKYRRALRAVALLGADTPAVENLDDFINLYTEIENDEIHICEKKEKEGTIMDEKEILEMKQKIEKYEKIEQEQKKLNEKLELAEKENEKLKTYIADKEKKSYMDEVNAYLEGKVKDGIITPFQAKMFSRLGEEKEKVFKYSKDDKDVEGNAFDIIKEVIESKSPEVDFSQQTQMYTQKKKTYSNSAQDENDLDFEIRAYMKENNMKEEDYGRAYDEISKKHYMEA